MINNIKLGSIHRRRQFYFYFYEPISLPLIYDKWTGKSSLEAKSHFFPQSFMDDSLRN